MNVPPRFRRRSTATCASRSIVCATISPRTICSVKFFEPIRITGPVRRDAAVAATTSSGTAGPAESRCGRPDDRQQRIQNQDEDRDARAETANERQRQQEPEHCEAWNRLDDVRQPDDWCADARTARRENPGRDADENRDGGRRD